ncbi:helix-turn-helix domain-containing protein [Clostridium perfringens]
MARISGVSHIIIMNIESGKSRNPTITSIMKLAKALDITIDKLVYGEE